MASKFTFQKAVKLQEKLRFCGDGPPGGGKTMTCLRVGTFLAEKEGGRIALIDSERSSAKKYANLFDFDHLTLPDFDPFTYTEAIRSAIEGEYAVIIVDSLSHAWEGTLAMKDRVQKRSKSNDGFGAWREVTPVHEELVDTLLRAPAHVLTTMRTKMAHDYEKDDEGHLQVRKLGLRPIQRDGVEYEFDVVGDFDQENNFMVSKTRCPQLRGKVMRMPGEDLAQILWDWLQDGEPPAALAIVADLKGRCASLPEPLVGELLERRKAMGLPVLNELAASQVEQFTLLVKELEQKAADMPVEGASAHDEHDEYLRGDTPTEQEMANEGAPF